MPKKYKRQEFLKLMLLGNLALLSRPLQTLASDKRQISARPASGDNVVYYRKGDAEYETLRKGFNKRINKFPLIIALCKNTTGVSEAIRYAIQNKLPVAVKSGGHCMEGFSVNDNGMVINLSQLNTVEFENSDTVITGPGATLSSIYDKLLPKGRIMPGGSCAGVGIGGLVLGGGYGLLARKFGLTCDSLLELTLVDGMGNVINSKDDKELLWACKGGGNGNFGVVTSLKFKTHKAPATLQSFRFTTKNAELMKAKALMQKWFEVSALLPVSCFSAFVLNRKTVYILLTNADKHNPEIQKIVDQLSALSAKTTQSKPQPLAAALKVFYGRPNPMFFKNASAGLYKSYADVEACIGNVIETVMKTPGMIYQVNTLGGNIQNTAAEAAAAFPHRAYPFFSELQTYWETEKQETRLLERFQQVQEMFTANGISAQYRNYPDVNFKNWEEAYYGAGYARLQQIKKKYDPANVFRYEQSIT